MRLNIETKNPQAVKEILEGVFINENVTLERTYNETADYNISSRFTKAEYVYNATCIIELSHDIPLEKIRIY